MRKPTVQTPHASNRDRMIGLFGWREMELAAIKILDTKWREPFTRVDESIFVDGDERDGWEELKKAGWIDRNGVPSPAFWRRVHGR
jgi:hypothetical protein